MKRTISIFLAMLMALEALSGCQNQKDPPAITESMAWEVPQLNYGVFKYEKLEVLPWYSGRTEATSLTTMAETETGFYQISARWLYYADKADLSNWVPVCGDPSCDHMDSCDAIIDCGRILISGDRIIYEANPQDIPTGNTIQGGGFILASKNLNGTFRQTEYILEDMLTAGRSVSSSLLLQDQWLVQKFSMQPNGTLVGKLYRVTRKGPEILGTLEDFDPLDPPESIHDAAYLYGLNGERYFTTGIFGKTRNIIYRCGESGIQAVDVTDLTLRGAYISGNTLRFFVPGKGYFDRNLDTGEEVFLAPARLQRSQSCILLPNCILESSLLLPSSTQSRMPGMPHKLTYFDGEGWQDVALPNELINASTSVFLTPLAVTSDSILLCCMGNTAPFMGYTVALYRISLTAEQKQLEFLSEI